MTQDSFFAARMSRFEPSASQLAAVRVRELIAQGRDIVKLTTGEPDFPTPDHVKEAVAELMRNNAIAYTPVNGTLALRTAIRQKFLRDNDLDYPLDQISVGCGTKQVIFNALMATVQSGDEVIIPAPFWNSYPDMVKLAGGVPVSVVSTQDEGFKLTPQAFEKALSPRSKWLLFNSPGNPTGAVYSADEIRALAAVALRHPQVHILCDDVYEHLIFDSHRFATFAAVEPRLRDRVLTCNGVSKGYSMTGWRVGFAGGPKPLIANIVKMQSQSTAGASAVSQAAAAAALSGPQELVRERTANLQRRRDILFDQFRAIPGLNCDLPEGAMYIYCECADLIGKATPAGQVLRDDTDVVMYFLDSAGVALVQGSPYGLSPYFRASFVASEPDLRRAGERLKEACAALT